MTRSPDVIIIGAGVVGAACARALASAGHAVLVLEQDIAGGGVTAAGMGHIVVMDDSPAQLALTAWSRALLHQIANQLPAEVEYHQCGTLWIARDEAELAGAKAKQATLAAAGVRTELLDGPGLGAAEPALRPGLAGALLVPDDAVLYQPRLTRWLLREASDHGAIIHDRVGPVLLTDDGVDVRGTKTSAACVVVAAGPESTTLLPGLPVIPRKGHLAVTNRMPPLVHHQLVELGYLKSAHTMSAESIAFNVQPRRSGQVLIGSSRELAGHDRRVNSRLLQRMLQLAAGFIPGLAGAEILRVWTGCRPATPDNLPLIGPWPARRGTWVATGHEGLGITTALGTAEILTAMLQGSAPPLDAAMFDPARPMPDAGALHDE